MPVLERRARRTVAFAFVVAIVLGCLATPASAHAELLSSDPAPGATLATSPAAVALTFSERVEAAFGSVRVFDGRGNRVDNGVVTQFANQTGVRTALGELASGTYVVTWRVVSADSHPVDGAFTFQVGTKPVAVDRSLVQRLLDAPGGDSTVTALFAGVRFLEFLSLAVFVGGLLVLAGVWPLGWSTRRVRRVVVGGGAVAGVCTALGIVLQGANAAGFPLSDSFRWSVIDGVLGTRYGTTSLVRLVALALAICLSFASGPARRFGAPIAGVVGLVSLSFAGHASVASPAAVAVALDAAHLVAGAYWIGGLALLLTVVLSTSTSMPEDRGAVVMRITGGFPYAVLTIVITGVLAAWREVGSFAALTNTNYGLILIAKVAAFSLMVLVAVFGRTLALRRWGGPGETADPVIDAEDGPSGEAGTRDVRRLRRGVAVEAVFGIVVFALTSLLVSGVPAKQDYARGQQFSRAVTSTDGRYVFDVDVDPARVGRNDVHVTVSRSDGALVSVLSMNARIRLPAQDIAAIDLPMRKLGPGHAVAPGVSIPIAGDWQLTVRARVDQFTETVISVRVPIH